MARVGLQRHKKRKIHPQLYDPGAKNFMRVISRWRFKKLAKCITIGQSLRFCSWAMLL